MKALKIVPHVLSRQPRQAAGIFTNKIEGKLRNQRTQNWPLCIIFGFLFDSINIMNSFRLKKKTPKKCYSHAKLLSENNSTILIILISRWQLGCRLLKSMNVFQKWKERSCPFSSSKPRPKKGKKAFSCEAAADLASSDKFSFLNHAKRMAARNRRTLT